MMTHEQNQSPSFVVVPNLPLQLVRTALGIALFFFIFYLGGHYLLGWAFPTPRALAHILIVSFGGVLLGWVFSRVWPLPPVVGFERVVRTLLLMVPALGIGIALHVWLQGPAPERALYLIFALAAWLGSGYIVRTP